MEGWRGGGGGWRGVGVEVEGWRWRGGVEEGVEEGVEGAGERTDGEKQRVKGGWVEGGGVAPNPMKLR